MVFGDIKRRLVVTRAQGAFAVADLAAEQGDFRRALGLFRQQARDLSARGADKDLEVRGWLGVLTASSGLLAGGEAPGDGLREALGALARLDRSELPTHFSRYDAYRDLGVQLLARSPERAVELARCLTTFFPTDPRPHYLHARALEHDLDAIEDEAARAQRASKALDAYREALTDASEVGSRRRWEATLSIRMAALLWRYRRGVDPDAGTKALELVQNLPRDLVSEAPSPYRLIIAQVWLGAGRAMDRLRALDMLDELVADPTYRQAALHVVDDYLETLGWSYYPTEQDRVRAIVAQVAPALGPDVARRSRAYLELLSQLHDSEGRRALPSSAHLETLLEFERNVNGESVTAAYHAIALRLVEAPAEDFDRVLAEGLDAWSSQVRTLWTRMLVEPLAVALGALTQLRHADKTEVRQLLRAFAYPSYQVPHVQEAFALLVPVLLDNWSAFSENVPLMVEAIERYIRLARTPSFGFSALGLAMLEVGEVKVATQAARRAVAARHAEPSDTLDALLAELSNRALRRGEVAEAAGWLLAARPAGEEAVTAE